MSTRERIERGSGKVGSDSLPPIDWSDKAAGSKERRRRLVAEHKCVDCCQVKPETLAGAYRCNACNKRRSERARALKNGEAQKRAPLSEEERLEYKRAYNRDYMKDLRRWRRENGLCVICGAKDAYTMAGRASCAECAEKKREYDEAKRRTNGVKKKAIVEHEPTKEERLGLKRSAWADNGRCYICGEPLDGGKQAGGEPARLCAYHLKKLEEAGRKSRENRRKRPTPPWSNNKSAWDNYFRLLENWEKRGENHVATKED